MKTISLATLALLATTTAFAQGASPYDYWVDIAQIPSMTTNTTVTQNVMIFAGNHGPGAPYYDFSVTVKRNGTTVCQTGASTQPPILPNKQKNLAELQVAYPRSLWIRIIKSGKITYDKYLVIANINTQYPNDDTNPANGFVSKEFSFPAGGTSTCKTLQDLAAQLPPGGSAKNNDAGTVSITSIDEKTGSVTVRNDATGRAVQFKITNSTALKSLRVGQVIAAPASPQSRIMERRPGLGVGPQSPNRCFEDCMAAPQTTVLECMYWCATRDVRPGDR
jgi:hypothetical protein